MKRSKVFVAMSGGVDSAVAAALLKRRGDSDLFGVFIKVADFGDQWGIKCSWREERREAMRAAAHLGIPLVTIDLSREYEKQVVDYMVREYRAGRTPNPDVMCNRKIKFGALFRWARARGADYVATGHYVRIARKFPITNSQFSKENSESKNLNFEDSLQIANCKLLIACDPAKDQSYFLWTLTQAELAHCLFPIGDYTKTEVRRLAKKFGLLNAEKKDSQGLCFIGNLDLKDFLAKFIPERTGEVVNEYGEKIGQHRGAAFYTIGERHGFTVTKKTPHDRPYYVVDRDIKKNRLVVSNIEGGRGTSDVEEVALDDVNWISGRRPDSTKLYQAQIRYHGERYPIFLNFGRKLVWVLFKRLPFALAPGQSCVIYDGDLVLGGGAIV